jgi:molecular chaperone GrpE (heat shock protein)
VSAGHDSEDSFRARGEQAIGELAQALLDSQVLENALSAAFGAREKALEAQQAAMTALNVASAGDLERLERRVRALSQRFDEVEDQLDRIAADVAEIRRRLSADGKASKTPKAPKT